jgi:hypothetical protein
MPEEGVFRFVALRPANLKQKEEAADDKVPLYPDDPPSSKLYDDVRKAGEDGRRNGGRRKASAVAEKYKRSQRYVHDPRDLPFDVTPLVRWATEKASTELANVDVKQDVENAYGGEIGSLVESDRFRATRLALADTILADSIAPNGDDDDRSGDDVVAALKLMRIMERARDEDLPDTGRLGDLISRTAVVVPKIGALPAEEHDETARPQEREVEEGAKDERTERLRERLHELEVAHREISRMATTGVVTSDDVEEVGLAARIERMEARLLDVEGIRGLELGAERRDMPHVARAGAPEGGAIGIAHGKVVLREEAADHLSPDAKKVIDALKLDRTRIDPVATVGLIEEEMSRVGSMLASEQPQTRLLRIGSAYLDESRFRASLGMLARSTVLKALAALSTFRAGIGDLLMVRQKIKAYQLSEFAHVENVLEGESRERRHRRLETREEITITEEERETEKERDLQSTERNELQTEAEKTVKDELQIEAGLQVSGSYGPTVSFSASLNASFSTTTEETQRKATSYSREVTEKTAERVRERVREEIRRRVLQEIEETNRHAIDNTNGAGRHIRGIYRWLNKLYDAQVFNYGQRMMYEFVIPEPAAYFLYAMVENPPVEGELVKPDPPTYYGSPLKPSNLTRTNFHDYVSKYGVTNAPAPPAQFQTVAYFDKQDGNTTSNFGRSGKLDIPAGYAAYGAVVQSDYVFESGTNRSYRIMIGGQWFDKSNVAGADWRTFGQREKEISVAYELMNARSFTLGIDVFCQLTAEGFAKWQIAAYEAIIQAYQQQQAEYEDKLAAAAIQAGPQILGRNPLENRRLERDELKKLVIMMLTGTADVALDSFYYGAEPVIDIPLATANGAKIRFFENAFEWTNMLYVFYPYFWGRKPRWLTALHLVDPDPDFAAFLKAGAARVQVPVRPGFERAVAHFSQFGEIWEGNDAPLIDDEMYVPIVDEITENLGKLDDGVPYPEGSQPWEVTIPTSLVVVQDLEEIPGIEDVLTGNAVDLTGVQP